MLAKSDIEIIRIEEVSPTVLQFHFNVEWTMDSTTAITDHVLLCLSAKTIEVVQGADLYCLRIKYGKYEFLFNFEEYSHACWLECASEQDVFGLQAIKVLLS